MKLFDKVSAHWAGHLAYRNGDRRRAIDALRRGMDLGLTHIDTAEMYGSGAAERIVGEAIAGRRDKVSWFRKSCRAMLRARALSGLAKSRWRASEPITSITSC